MLVACRAKIQVEMLTLCLLYCMMFKPVSRPPCKAYTSFAQIEGSKPWIMRLQVRRQFHETVSQPYTVIIIIIIFL